MRAGAAWQTHKPSSSRARVHVSTGSSDSSMPMFERTSVARSCKARAATRGESGMALCCGSLGSSRRYSLLAWYRAPVYLAALAEECSALSARCRRHRAEYHKPNRTTSARPLGFGFGLRCADRKERTGQLETCNGLPLSLRPAQVGVQSPGPRHRHGCRGSRPTASCERHSNAASPNSRDCRHGRPDTAPTPTASSLAGPHGAAQRRRAGGGAGDGLRGRRLEHGEPRPGNPRGRRRCRAADPGGAADARQRGTGRGGREQDGLARLQVCRTCVVTSFSRA